VVEPGQVVNTQRTGLLHPYPARCCVPGQATLAFTPGTVSANLTATEGARTGYFTSY